MASLNLNFFCLFAFCMVLLPCLVLSNDIEDNVLLGINSYRKTLNLPELTKNGRADCIADEFADDLEDEPCTTATTRANIVGTSPTQLSDMPKYTNKCGVDINTTSDGVIMPVCVPKLIPTLVLTNYTHTQYVKYLNDSKYTGVGIGSEDDWMVIVLTTNSRIGSFSGAVSLMMTSRRFWAVLLLGFSGFVM